LNRSFYFRHRIDQHGPSGLFVDALIVRSSDPISCLVSLRPRS
jgi:hypothetical protein